MLEGVVEEQAERLWRLRHEREGRRNEQGREK